MDEERENRFERLRLKDVLAGAVSLRSLRSNERCFVRFMNHTERPVDIMWLNYDGAYVRYRILNKGDYLDVNTYTSHPWIAKDFLSRDTLSIDGKYIYNPRTTREVLQERYPNREIPPDHEARIRAYITLPLYSLRYAALLTIRNRMLRETDVDSLALPNVLKEDLKKVIAKRNSDCVTQSLIENHMVL